MADQSVPEADTATDPDEEERCLGQVYAFLLDLARRRRTARRQAAEQPGSSAVDSSAVSTPAPAGR